MATTIDQQVALDESLVPSTQTLRIGRSNFRLPLDIQSKEYTLQVVHDVLWNSPLFRAFQVTADVSEIYMQEFWATAKPHHNSICFKIETKKSVLDLEAFKEMLHISPRIPNQSFADLPTEEEILDFLSTGEGTGSRPGVPDVPYDDSEEELSWNSFDDEDVGVVMKRATSLMKVMMIVIKEVMMILKRLSKLDEEDQDLRLSEEAGIQEEEEDADELYRD
nr:hypothetical protein [Tanacetum cinerariifolium]